VVAVTPYFDTRLKWDPDYQGKKDRAVAGRAAEAYLAAQWRYGEVFFGSLARNWGWPGTGSLVLGAEPYSYDHLGIVIGTPSVRIEGVTTQLDDLTDSAGAVHHRYWVAHRVVLRPWERTTIVLWEGTLLAGVDRTLEPWYANILKLGLLAQYDEGTSANNLLGMDVEFPMGDVDAFGSILIDDIQVDDATPGDQEPTSYGLTVGARAPFGPAVWSAFYTRASNLAYRTPSPAEAVMRRGVGLGRNYSDYDQLTLRAEGVLGPGIWSAEALRTGRGRLPAALPGVADFTVFPGRRWRRAAALARGRTGAAISHDGGVPDETWPRGASAVAAAWAVSQCYWLRCGEVPGMPGLQCGVRARIGRPITEPAPSPATASSTCSPGWPNDG
jgi:hypothetical protein